jgi:hypothetical protein
MSILPEELPGGYADLRRRISAARRVGVRPTICRRCHNQGILVTGAVSVVHGLTFIEGVKVEADAFAPPGAVFVHVCPDCQK